MQNIVVAGAGTMGCGIAQVFAQSGCDVYLVDTNAAQLELAIKKMQASMEKLAAKKLFAGDVQSALKRVVLSQDLAAFSKSDLFIEAIFENLEMKKDLFKQADRAFAPQTLFASNTSGLSITEISTVLSAERQLVGLHFFNPVPLMKLLEIVKGAQTSDESVEKAKELATKLDKEAIIVRDSPGFATSRLGICIAYEAIRMLETEVASAEDIDKAMVLGYGHPVGPLKLTDLVGLDVRLAIGNYLFQTLKTPHFDPPELLKRLVKEGSLGQKSGRGFYSW